MGILRKNKQSNFTTIDNHALKNKELSFKAKGLLVYMWSLPNDWNFYETEIVNHATDGISSVRSALKELQDAGYLLKQRKRDEKGKLKENDWLISDIPMFSPDLENPNLENPSLENPNLENHTLLNTNPTKDLSKQNTNKSNVTNIRSTERKAPTKHQYGEFKNVLLTDDEYQKLKDRFPNDLNQRIERLSDYVASTGKSYKSHYATIISWANRDKNKKPQKDTFQNTRNSQEDTEITPEMMKAYEELKQNERA